MLCNEKNYKSSTMVQRISFAIGYTATSESNLFRAHSQNILPKVRGEIFMTFLVPFTQHLSKFQLPRTVQRNFLLVLSLSFLRRSYALHNKYLLDGYSFIAHSLMMLYFVYLMLLMWKFIRSIIEVL